MVLVGCSFFILRLLRYCGVAQDYNLKNMKFILGKKIGMSQKFNEQGNVVPVTVVEAGPCQISQIKSLEKDKYQAVQIAFEKAKHVKKPQKGHLKDIEFSKYIHEFRIPANDSSSYKKGDKIDLTQFKIGDKVKVTGYSKGRGFQGVVKRHRFHGSPATHGHKDQLRMPGSIGERSFPGKVFKGQRMGGHMGDRRITVLSLPVVSIEPEKNLLYLKGAIPGAKNGLLFIYGKN